MKITPLKTFIKMKPLTPQQKERLKRTICALIDNDKSAFFFCGESGMNENFADGTAFVKGNTELLIRSLACTAAKSPISSKAIQDFIISVYHVLKLTAGVLSDAREQKIKDQNPN